MNTARYVENITTLFGKILARVGSDSGEPGIGLPPSQLQGLSYLFRHGESSVGDIAQGLGTTHPAAVRLVDRLERKGLVGRTESRSDRRVSLVALTVSGRELADRVLSKRTEALARALGRMDRRELEDVMRGLEALLAAALEDRRTVESVCLRCGDDHIGCCIVNRTHLELTGSTIERT
jgi:DNA-binding MarR family transcriptional regulator